MWSLQDRLRDRIPFGRGSEFPIDPFNCPSLTVLHLFLYSSLVSNRKKTASCLVTQSCLTFCNPLDCSLPGSTVHGISQASIREWVAISFYRGSSQPRFHPWGRRRVRHNLATKQQQCSDQFCFSRRDPDLIIMFPLYQGFMPTSEKDGYVQLYLTTLLTLSVVKKINKVLFAVEIL